MSFIKMKEEYDFAEWVDSTGVISNPEIIKYCFKNIIGINSMGGVRFSVTDETGDVWFSYGCDGMKG